MRGPELFFRARGTSYLSLVLVMVMVVVAVEVEEMVLRLLLVRRGVTRYERVQK